MKMPIAKLIGLTMMLVVTAGCCPCLKEGPSDPTKTLDLINADYDENGFPIAPNWQLAKQGWLQKNIDPRSLCGAHPDQCTTDAVTLNIVGVGEWPPPPVCQDSHYPLLRGGHWNWPAEAITYRGAGFLVLEGWNHVSGFGDDDYDLAFRGNTSAGLTRGNKSKSLGGEFRASETIYHFKTKWWEELKQNVERGKTNIPLGDWASVTGRFGLDTVHCYATELHPIYALAVRVESNTAARRIGRPEQSPDVTERWALFGRNWGNEGECGPHDQEVALKDGRIGIRLPWRPGMKSVQVAKGSCLRRTDSAQFPADAAVNMEVHKQSGIVVWLPLAAPKDHTRVSGELFLRWSVGDQSTSSDVSNCEELVATANFRTLLPSFKQRSSVGAITGKSSERTRKKVTKLSPADQERYYERMRAQVQTAMESGDDTKSLEIKVQR
jgi:hypothetical protein